MLGLLICNRSLETFHSKILRQGEEFPFFPSIKLSEETGTKISINMTLLSSGEKDCHLPLGPCFCLLIINNRQ